MRILLQHTRTQLYLRSLGSWTTNPLDAFDFGRAQRAVDFARKHALPGVQVIVTNTESGESETSSLSVGATSMAGHTKG